MANPKGINSVMNDAVVQKLLDAFALGFTDEEACLYTGISKQTLYNYCEKHPKFRESKELLKRSPIIKAKANVVKDLESGSLDTSKWYLERKVKEEFSLKQEYELSNKDDKPFEVSIKIVE